MCNRDREQRRREHLDAVYGHSDYLPLTSRTDRLDKPTRRAGPVYLLWNVVGTALTLSSFSFPFGTTSSM